MAQGNSAGTAFRLEAIDEAITAFAVTSGGTDIGISDATSATGFPLTIGSTHSSPTITPSRVDFTIEITTAAGTDTVVVSLLKADTDDNTEIGSDTIKLARADNSPTFDTAQELARRLNLLFETPNLVQYDPSDNSLTFDIGSLIDPVVFEDDLPR